jgi:hypothetical protein
MMDQPGGRDEPDGGIFAPIAKGASDDPRAVASNEADNATLTARMTFKKHEIAGTLNTPAGRKEIAAQHGVAARAHDRAAQAHWDGATQMKGVEGNQHFQKARQHEAAVDYHQSMVNQFNATPNQP